MRVQKKLHVPFAPMHADEPEGTNRENFPVELKVYGTKNSS